MSSLANNAHARDVHSEVVQRKATHSPASLPEHSNRTNSFTTNGDDKSYITTGRTPAAVLRKKLPWLEVSRSTATQVSEQGPQRSPRPTPHMTPSSHDHSPKTKLADPSASLDKGSEENPRAPRPLPPPLRTVAQHKTNAAGSTKLADYASSEYSTTSSTIEHLPANVAKKDPASYEQLVMHTLKSVPGKDQSLIMMGEIINQEPSVLAQESMGQTRRAKSKPNRSRQHKQEDISDGHSSPKRCRSCEIQFEQRYVPDSSVTPRSWPVAQPGEAFTSPPVDRRAPTIHSLPLHLTTQDSSSTSSNDATTQLDNLKRAVTMDVGAQQSCGTIDRAVADLGSLMVDAVVLAKEAAQHGRHEEVYSVFDNAASALWHANSVQNSMDRPASPLGTMRSSICSPIGVPSGGSSLRHGIQPETSSVHAKNTRPDLHRLVAAKYTSPAESKRAGTPQSCTFSSEDTSIARTPPYLYQPASTRSVVRDFAFQALQPRSKSTRPAERRATYGAAAEFYGDHGESIETQPGVRPSIVVYNKHLPLVPGSTRVRSASFGRKNERVHRAHQLHHALDEKSLAESSSKAVPSPLRDKLAQENNEKPPGGIQDQASPDRPQSLAFCQPAYFAENDNLDRKESGRAATAASGPPPLLALHNWSLKHPRRAHVSVGEGQNSRRKRLTASIACLNTIFIGLIAGIYAGEVPRIQFQLADQSHWVIFGNMLFFAGMGLTTLIFWPLPLLHGRRPYILMAFGLMLPLHIPQAIVVSSSRTIGLIYRLGLLLPRCLTGVALGFANINLLPMLLDLYGASLMSERPHQEIVNYDDVRRQGGGIGVWLGIWTFCYSSALSVGFCVGACIISKLDPSWGFWIIIMLLAFFLLINVIAPETRKAAYRRSVHHFYDGSDPERVKRRVARGEVKLHISNDGPKYWWEEVWAGLVLTKRMACQGGFAVLMIYLAWIYAQLTLVILLLGALLSRNYKWASQWVGLAALSVPIGAALAMPLTKASWLSRSRVKPPRTDSMTMRQPRFTWSSHLIRRIVFSLLLPFAGLAYCLTSPGPPLHWSACVIFAGFMGFLTDLGTAECIGLIMETFDTCDLQPGDNTKHRLQSLPMVSRRRRTNYSSFPRVCACFFASQSLGFFLAAAATVISGRVTNAYGTQMAISIIAAILLGVTLMFLIVIFRWKEVQVIPDFTGQGTSKDPGDPEWKAVIIGHPSGKMRRMNFLEMGKWSRWSEIRRLNKLERQ